MRGVKRPVRIVDTGEVFPSVAEAAIALGVQAGSVRRAMKLYGKVAGVALEYVEEKEGKDEKTDKT